jgi:large repetitive protein
VLHPGCPGRQFPVPRAHYTVARIGKSARLGHHLAVALGGVSVRAAGRTLAGALSLAMAGTLLGALPAAAADIGFNWSHLKDAGGNTIRFANPTSLQFGPDGRLYVAHQDGTIRVYDVIRRAANDYRATATETITLIKDIPNHDDDGQPNASVNGRLMTGLYVAGTASKPVMYVTSSDPRFGVLSGELDLDTNSGIVSRLTWDGSSWQKVDLVRGLPRSAEIHAPNGLALKDGVLYVTVGGHTNHGAPSVNFGLLPEYALSAAILSIDLAAITSPPYDLPTLNDPDRAGNPDANDPFGGNDGKNQAKLVSGGPVQVHAGGFRNAYDLRWHSNGSLYAMDNGGNEAAGAPPVGEGPTGVCTNGQNEGGITDRDGLYRIGGAGYYQGHPNPTRGNRSNTFGGQTPVPAGMENPEHCDYQSSGSEDGSVNKDPSNDGLTFFNFSTNGIGEYTASNFEGAMKNNLLLAQLDQGGTGTIFRVALNANGTFNSRARLPVSGFGNDPLDVTAQGDAGQFPGTVWVAMHGSDEIVVLEPNDFGGSTPPPCSGADDPALDEDGDGYDNADEIDNATDPCSAGSIPPDWDGDLTSDLNDPDDDNDGLSDLTDPFQQDPDNGSTTNLPVRVSWDATAPDPGWLIGSGFSGLMVNGTTDYLTLYDPANMTVGSAAGVFAIDNVPGGDARGSLNDQAYGFQRGVNVSSATGPFVARTRLNAPFAAMTPQDNQSMGLMLGTGHQDNYVKIVADANGGNGGFRFLKEVNGTVSNEQVADVAMPGTDFVDLYLEVDPAAATVLPRYSVTTGCATTCVTGPVTDLGAPVSIPASWVSGSAGLAVGLISTSRGAPEFPATWDFFEVKKKGSGAAGWESRAPTGFPRMELSYAEVGGKFYLAGGLAPGGGDSTRQQVYDPATDTWADVAPLPMAVHHVQAISLGGKIYYIGGIDLTGNEIGAVQIYDPDTDSFSSGAPMPRPRGAGGLAVRNGKIYYAGGLNGDVAVAWFDEYNPTKDRWTQLPAMPLTRDHFHAQTVGGKFYALGGRNKKIGSTRSKNAVYDFSTGTWTTSIANIPTPRGGVASAVVGDEILVIGGEGGGQVWDTVEAYDPTTDTWRTLDPMPTARHGMQAVNWDGGIYIAAGSKKQGGGQETDVHEVYFPGGPATDDTLPTAPSNLQATAVSSTEIDLTWDPATDDVGVTSHRIQRDAGGGFSTVATVGSVTSYSDTTVTGGYTYLYRVQACDAASNCGPFSNTAEATTPSEGGDLLYSDGFETGFDWDIVKQGIVRQNTHVNSGSWAVRATSTSSDGQAFARDELPSAQGELYYRTFFKVISQGGNQVILQRLWTADRTWLLSLHLTAAGKLGYKNHLTGGSKVSSVVPSQGAWHELQVRVVMNGASSVTEVWLDGTKIDSLTNNESLGTTAVGHLQIGDTTASRTFDVGFDDVAADESFIS